MNKIGFAFFALLALSPTPAFSQETSFISEYTPVDRKSCKDIPQPKAMEGDDSFKQRCPGRDGYTVYEEGGDNRSWLVLEKGKQRIELQGIATEDAVFPVLWGGKLDWRYQVKNGQKQLVALIFRMGGYDHKSYEAGNYEKKTTMLYVLRFDGSRHCILGKSPSNEEARKLADNGAPCPAQ